MGQGLISAPTRLAPATPSATSADALTIVQEVVARIGANDIPAMIGACELLKAQLIAKAITAAVEPARVEEDRLLNVTEAAKKLGCSEDWLYQNAKNLPFVVRRSPRRLGFSLAGIERYIRGRTG